MAPSILIADDHPLFRDALAGIAYSSIQGMNVLAVGDINATIKALEENPETDLVLLDLKMPGAMGFSGLIFLRNQFPKIPIAIVSASETDASIKRSISLGASGFIPKSSSPDVMKAAICQILEGNIWIPDESVLDDSQSENEFLEISSRISSLTPQQMRVLMMLMEGLLNKQIANNLSITEATVKAHVSAILVKLEVYSRTKAVILASQISERGEEIRPI